MPLATTCDYGEQTIGIEEALRIRDATPRDRRGALPFRCIKCGKPVRPHKKGTTAQEAHFEHRESNKACPLGDKKR